MLGPVQTGASVQKTAKVTPRAMWGHKDVEMEARRAILRTNSSGYGMDHGSAETWVLADLGWAQETLLRDADSASLGSGPGPPILQSLLLPLPR